MEAVDNFNEGKEFFRGGGHGSACVRLEGKGWGMVNAQCRMHLSAQSWYYGGQDVFEDTGRRIPVRLLYTSSLGEREEINSGL